MFVSSGQISAAVMVHLGGRDMWGSKAGPNDQFRGVLWVGVRHNPRLDVHSGALSGMVRHETSNESEVK